jgi:hypothetical protein
MRGSACAGAQPKLRVNPFISPFFIDGRSNYRSLNDRIAQRPQGVSELGSGAAAACADADER